jgi:hypothetical protein
LYRKNFSNEISNLDFLGSVTIEQPRFINNEVFGKFLLLSIILYTMIVGDRGAVIKSTLCMANLKTTGGGLATPAIISV